MSSSVDRMIQRLPSVYNKEQGSNNYRLLFVPGFQVDRIFESLQMAKVWRLNLDKAKGKTLDHIGGNLQQFRGGDDDTDYRLWLKVKQIANTSKGDLESLSRALELMIQEAYIALYETWMFNVFLNQEEGSDYDLGDSGYEWFLTGYDSDRDPVEPASVVAEFCHQTLFDLLGEYYTDIVDREIYLDGWNPFDGAYTNYLWHETDDPPPRTSNEDYIVLDGGFTTHPGDELDKMMITTRKIKQMMNIIRAAGVGLWWKGYVPFYGVFEITEDDPYSTYILQQYSAITHVAFGNEGHNSDGSPKEPTGSEVAVYGTEFKKEIEGTSVSEGYATIHGILDWDEAVDYNISSIGLYAGNDLVAIKNFSPAAKDDRTRFIVRWKIPHSFTMFNGDFNFDGTIKFNGLLPHSEV